MKKEIEEALAVIRRNVEEEFGKCEEFHFMCSSCMVNRCLSDLEEAMEWIEDDE